METTQLIHLNHQEAQNVVALNFSLPEINNGELPEWLPLLEKGKQDTRDGRVFINNNPEAIIDWIINVNKKHIQIDIEHATQLKAPLGDPAPSHGKILANHESLEVRDGTIWGKIKWNKKGRQVVGDEEYIYYSPAVPIDEKTNHIIGIVSIGLTNSPNFYIPALNSQQPKHQPQKETNPMELADLLAALGLPATDTMQDCVTAINSMKAKEGELQTALNAAQTKQPDMTAFIPRADYDLALNRATTAEETLATQAADALATQVDVAINSALEAGKITPATVDYYKGQCGTAKGLNAFEDFVKSAPAVIDDSTKLSGKKIDGDSTALNQADKDAAKALGISEADMLARKNPKDKKEST